jgi:hypothetical protein
MRNTAGIRAIKLYFVQTARARPRPRNAALFIPAVFSDKNLLTRKSTSTNNGTVMLSVPIVTAWMTRAGRNARKNTSAE